MTPAVPAKLHTTVSELFAGPVRDYSIYANQRSIPHVIDGLKPTQRKILYGMTLKAPSVPHGGIKVAQLASFVAEVTAYHHGEGSVAGAIVKMAQKFPGANNLPLLAAIGQFGSRMNHNAAAARYIFTDLSPVAKKLLHPADALILKHLEDDGDKIEPEYYLPILPMILVNGSLGMGTGHATNISLYSPQDLKDYILAKLAKKPTTPLVPWYRGFKGKVERREGGQVVITGKIERVNSTTLRITELPPDVEEDQYKEFLNDLVDADVIKDYNNASTTAGWDITLTVPRALGYEDEAVWIKKFKLQARMTENFTVWLPNGKLKCFDSADDLCDYFIEHRLSKYEERRLALLKVETDLLAKLSEKLRFIRYYLDADHAQQFSKMTKAQMQAKLAELGFTIIDQLLDIPIYKLTKDEIEKLEKEIVEVNAEIARLNKATAQGLYVEDLKALDLSKELA